MADLAPLVAELDGWAAAGRIATFWWRDDDAGAPCAALDRLLAVADGRPLALAAIPARTDAALAARLADAPQVAIFQHGWRHDNHAAAPPNSEYPAGRDPAIVARELRDGHDRLARLFGARFRPVFTPPWHGLDAAYLPLLHAAGLRGLSSKGPRADRVAPGFVQHNVHCVPIRWSDPPGFGDPAHHVGQLVAHLRARRGGADVGEATGILTHHRDQDDESLAFMAALLTAIDAHPAARLVSPVELFG